MSKKAKLSAFIFIIAPVIALLFIVVSVRYGAKEISAREILDSVFHFDENNIDHQIIRISRLPRVIGAMLIGVFLAVSGALMQGITRNYLASPSIMGVSDGSVFLVTVCMVFMPDSGSVSLIAMSMMGSACGAGIVFGLAWLIPRGMTPARLAILGTVIGTFLGGLSQTLASYFQVSLGVSLWYNARLHQLDPELIRMAIPFALVGLVLAAAVSGSVTAVSLGDDVAAGLGVRTKLVKGLAMLAVVILTGVSVALVGKIAFVGLIIPHIARMFAGADYRWIIPLSGVLGGLFLPLCDLLSRFVNYPFETPVGVVTALFGVPFFLYLIRTRGDGKNA